MALAQLVYLREAVRRRARSRRDRWAKRHIPRAGSCVMECLESRVLLSVASSCRGSATVFLWRTRACMTRSGGSVTRRRGRRVVTMMQQHGNAHSSGDRSQET